MTVDIDYLRECFDYDPESGVLTWRERPRSHFKSAHAAKAWNAKCAGRQAGNLRKSDGYLRVRIGLGGAQALCHRVAFAIHWGRWPVCLIDHVNGVRHDNRAENLREATRNENAHNRKANVRSACALKGVSKARCGVRWRARIAQGGRVRSLGEFDTPDEAHAAYCAAAAKFHGNFARTA